MYYICLVYTKPSLLLSLVLYSLALALVLYFIIGAVILKVRFQKTGSDMIPNKGFWFALPVLIKVRRPTLI